MRWAGGATAAEALVALLVAGLAIAVAVPATSQLREGARLTAGARELVLTLQALRWRSVAQRRHHGMLFRREAGEWVWVIVRDGNGNGVRLAEVRDGVDPVLSGPTRLQDRVPGIRPGLPVSLDLPAIPPATGALGDGDPVRFGKSDLIAFGRLGGSTSGTIYLTGPAGGVAAVRWFGPTGRARVWRFDRRRGAWTR